MEKQSLLISLRFLRDDYNDAESEAGNALFAMSFLEDSLQLKSIIQRWVTKIVKAGVWFLKFQPARNSDLCAFKIGFLNFVQPDPDIKNHIITI